MSFKENIEKNNIILPKAADPVGSYVASKISGKLILYQDKFQSMKMVF